MKQQPSIIALVGIDGAGKSTIIDLLKNDFATNDVEFIHKVHRENTTRLERMNPDFANSPDAYWAGNFARAWRWAHALDFLKFYEEQFLPRFNAGHSVIADRWIECVIAFANAGTNIRPEIEALLAPCRPADLTIMIDVDPTEAGRRIVLRGDLRPDEHPRLLYEYRRSYQQVLSNAQSKVVWIPSTSVEETKEKVVAAINSFWSENGQVPN